VREVVEEGAQEVVDALREFDEINARFGEDPVDDEMDKLIERPGQAAGQARPHGRLEPRQPAGLAMDALRCPPGDTPVAVSPAASGGAWPWCRLLLKQPDILLLDEPTNHLDAESVAWLEKHLQHYPGTVIAVTHDRYFLDNVAGWILELDRGYGIPWKGNYSSWLEQKQDRLAKEESRGPAHEDLERELEWIHMSPPRGKPRARRASAYNELLERAAKGAAKSWRSTSRRARAWATS
jgi:sulfate-transporting ATPase